MSQHMTPCHCADHPQLYESRPDGNRYGILWTARCSNCGAIVEQIFRTAPQLYSIGKQEGGK